MAARSRVASQIDFEDFDLKLLDSVPHLLAGSAGYFDFKCYLKHFIVSTVGHWLHCPIRFEKRPPLPYGCTFFRTEVPRLEPTKEHGPA